MQIVIDIDDMAYKFVQDTAFVEDESTMFEQTNADRKKTLLLFDILDAIKNGTPLPKGHGRLIDADSMKTMKNIQSANFNAVALIRLWIDKQDTIIEADTESEDKA